MIEWIITSSILIVIVIALRYALRGRIDPRIIYALWALVLVRLLVPVSFGKSGVSVMNAVPEEINFRESAVTASAEKAETDPDEEGKTQNGKTQETAVKPAPGTQQSAATAAPVTSASPVQTPDPTSVPTMKPTDFHGTEAPKAAAETKEDAETPKKTVSTKKILNIIGLVGAAATAILLFTANLRLALKLRRSRRKYAVEGCMLPVYITEAISAPCLFGLFRPAIYITPEAAEDERKLSHIIAHESAHCRHGDHIFALLRCVCLVLHWYNPLVWFAALLSSRDSELACDEAAIKTLGESERAEYGRTLIELTNTTKHGLLTSAVMLNGGSSDRGLKERITMIAKKPKTKWFVIAGVLILAAIAVIITFTSARDKKKANTEPEKDAQTVTASPTPEAAATPIPYPRDLDGIGRVVISIPVGTEAGDICVREKELEGYSTQPEDFRIRDGMVYILNSVAENVLCYDMDGSYLKTIVPEFSYNWGDSDGSLHPESFRLTNLCVGNDKMYVINYTMHDLSAFDREKSGGPVGEKYHIRGGFFGQISNDVIKWNDGLEASTRGMYEKDGKLVIILDGSMGDYTSLIFDPSVYSLHPTDKEGFSGYVGGRTKILLDANTGIEYRFALPDGDMELWDILGVDADGLLCVSAIRKSTGQCSAYWLAQDGTIISKTEEISFRQEGAGGCNDVRAFRLGDDMKVYVLLHRGAEMYLVECEMNEPAEQPVAEDELLLGKYDMHDFLQLRQYVTSPGAQNLSEGFWLFHRGYDPNDPGTWYSDTEPDAQELVWDEDTGKLVRLKFSNLLSSGTLALTDMDALTDVEFATCWTCYFLKISGCPNLKTVKGDRYADDIMHYGIITPNAQFDAVITLDSPAETAISAGRRLALTVLPSEKDGRNYDLRLNVTRSGNGSVAVDMKDGVLILSAFPGEDMGFTGWYDADGDLLSESPSYALFDGSADLVGEYEIVAHFAQLPHPPGDISNVRILPFESEIFTDEEIMAAINVILEEFNSESWWGCTMVEIGYAGDAETQRYNYAKSIPDNNGIVLISTFTTGDRCVDGALDYNATWSDWLWILIRRDGVWYHVDHGY